MVKLYGNARGPYTQSPKLCTLNHKQASVRAHGHFAASALCGSKLLFKRWMLGCRCWYYQGLGSRTFKLEGFEPLGLCFVDFLFFRWCGRRAYLGAGFWLWGFRLMV